MPRKKQTVEPEQPKAKGKPRGSQTGLIPGWHERPTTTEMRNVRRERFAYGYLAYGNAREAARYAGTSDQPRAVRNYLADPKTQELIKKLLAEANAERPQMIADAGEVLEFLTKTMRGEIQVTGDQVEAAFALANRLQVKEAMMIARIWAWRMREVTLDVNSLFKRKDGKRENLKEDFDAEQDWEEWWTSF